MLLSGEEHSNCNSNYKELRLIAGAGNSTNQTRETEKRCVTLYERNDKFDLVETGMTIVIAILAITSLTQFEWLYRLSLVPTAFGVVMGLAGLLNWNIHPQWLIKLLGS